MEVDVGAGLLLAERARRRLFWVDMNQVRLFYSWMRSFHGRAFEETVHTMYKWCGILPVYPTLVHEFQFFATYSRGPRIAVDKVRYDIWEVVATDWFGFFGASFVDLALHLSQFKEAPQDGWEPLQAAVMKKLENKTSYCFFWNRPDLEYLLITLFSDVKRQASPSFIHNLDVKELHARVWGLFLQFKGISKSRLELDHPWNVFDVTELVCQLFYTWLLATTRDLVDGLAHLSTEMKLLSFSLWVNSTSLSHVKLITSDRLQQLENWVKFRMPVLYQGEDIFAPGSVFPVTLIQKLITEVRVPGIQVDRCPPMPTGSRLDMFVKVDLHSSVLELDFETGDMARLFASWLRCRGGVFKHQLIVQQVDEAYSRMGWLPCKCSSLVEEIRSTLSSRELSHEQAQARYNVWLESCPKGIRLMKGERSFVNLIAAVSMHMEEESWEPDGEPSWELVEKARYHATTGGYHLLKPLLVQGEDAGVNEVVLYLVEELRYWKRTFDMDDDGDEVFDFVFPECPRMDDLRAARLPDVTREGVERQLERPTIALCRDVTMPVLRILSSWHKKCGSGREAEESKAWKSLEYCLYIYGGAGWIPEATHDDVEVCQRAASDGLTKVIALLTGGCEVGPLIRRLLEDLRVELPVMSGKPVEKLCDAVNNLTLAK